MKIFAILALGASLVFGSIDVNSADKEALMSLNGIGQVKAEAIMAYREMQCIGSFKELQSIRGIGESIVAKNKDAVNFGSCKK